MLVIKVKVEIVPTHFEVVAVWDGELFTHSCATLEDAFEWADAYTEQKNCAVRIWRV